MWAEGPKAAGKRWMQAGCTVAADVWAPTCDAVRGIPGGQNLNRFLKNTGLRLIIRSGGNQI